MSVCRALPECSLATGWRFRACRLLPEISKCWGFRAWCKVSSVVMPPVLLTLTCCSHRGRGQSLPWVSPDSEAGGMCACRACCRAMVLQSLFRRVRTASRFLT